MNIPEILKGDVHLPLTLQTVKGDAVTLANSFYQTDLKEGDFKESQAYKDNEGQLVLELLDKESGEVVVRFVNKSRSNTIATPAMLALWNPLNNSTPGINWLAQTVKIFSAEELSFLDEVGSGNTYPLDSDNTVAWKLATLLNEYSVAGRWISGTYGELSTAGFTLVFKGAGDKAPLQFMLGKSDCLALIRINNGKRQGYLCLKS